MKSWWQMIQKKRKSTAKLAEHKEVSDEIQSTTRHLTNRSEFISDISPKIKTPRIESMHR